MGSSTFMRWPFMPRARSPGMFFQTRLTPSTITRGVLPSRMIRLTMPRSPLLLPNNTVTCALEMAGKASAREVERRLSKRPLWHYDLTMSPTTIFVFFRIFLPMILDLCYNDAGTKRIWARVRWRPARSARWPSPDPRYRFEGRFQCEVNETKTLG